MEPITEKTYPVKTRWLVKKTTSYWLLLLAMLSPIAVAGDVSAGWRLVGLGYLSVPLVLDLFVIANIWLQWRNFHYALAEDFLVVQQGIISKRETHVPYGVIQSVLIRRGVWDRIFGLSTLVAENATQAGTSSLDYVGQRSKGNNLKLMGVFGNKVLIPGLMVADAEALKEILLQKSLEKSLSENKGGGL